MPEEMIIDADICIKLGSSSKYPFLLQVLPLIAKKIYMHAHAFSEIMSPKSALDQLENLAAQGILTIVNETKLELAERALYDMTYNKLAELLIDPRRSNKNKGEVCSLAYAKVKGITIFATDESDLQPMINLRLNTGLNDIHCLRIVDIITMAKNNEISLPRKNAKALWVISGKNKDDFDRDIWPLE